MFGLCGVRRARPWQNFACRDRSSPSRMLFDLLLRGACGKFCRRGRQKMNAAATTSRTPNPKTAIPTGSYVGNLDLAGVSTTAGKRLWGSYAVNLAMAGSRIGLASCTPSESEAYRRRWAANRPNRGEAAIFGPRQASTRTQVQRYGAAHSCHGFAGCCRFDLLTRLDFPPVHHRSLAALPILCQGLC
jgi:hypothetical protein